ncbi:copper amine oxidase N-terminal domain-containing protein [Paenibacillus sp. N1-5-1-14]|uniref:copper amine oxidase N-terminal domain-containing protein n=1 Tax=Paenibacillus radicibacter TaxID=2972488 RepID=UPI002158FE61|nr:copper amine oxidase N-terminal domain-containing protein [Paenibacillus radicibacter]MCR8642865.1 copper amine oxidase N-terminal domain-containing protein [Paenibacillus radicibacter]
MKKLKVMMMVLLMTMLAVSVAVVPASAATQSKEITFDEGIKVIIPNYLETKVVQVDFEENSFDVTTLVVELPQKNANGEYPIFEIRSTNKKANFVSSYPGIFGEGQLGSLEEAKFVDGKVLYNPKFAIKGELKDIAAGKVFLMNFGVYDAEGNTVLDAEGLNIMFVEKGTAATTKGETKPSKEEPKATASTTADPTASKVIVDGKDVAFEAYQIGDSNYFKLRDLAKVVNGTGKQFEVKWDGEKNAITLTGGQSYTADGSELKVSANPTQQIATYTTAKVYVNGKEVAFEAFQINNNNYFKLRDIGKALDFGVAWDEAAKSIGINTAVGYTE